MTEEEQIKSPIRGYIGGMILDREFPDGVALRKTMFKATKSYYDKHKAERLIGMISENHPAKEFYENIGFQIDRTRGSKHITYAQ
jgi:hypothetical protein